MYKTSLVPKRKKVVKKIMESSQKDTGTNLKEFPGGGVKMAEE